MLMLNSQSVALPTELMVHIIGNIIKNQIYDDKSKVMT